MSQLALAHPEKPLETYLLLFIVTLAWGISWPVTAIALKYVPPFWLATLRQAIAMASLFIYLLLTRQFCVPTRQDISIVLSGGLLFAGLFVAFLNWALLYVHVGRAAILTYTTPFWVVVLSFLFLKRIPSREQLIGVICGLIGIIILFNPQRFNWSDKNVLMGNGLLILAALCWAIVIIHIREHKWHNTPLQLVPWQLLISLPLLGVLAAIYEPHAQIDWRSMVFLLTLLFLSFIASAFCFVGSTIVNQRLPAVTISLGFLGVPIISLAISAIFLGEQITWLNAGAIGLIILGLVIVVLGDLKNRRKNGAYT